MPDPVQLGTIIAIGTGTALGGVTLDTPTWIGTITAAGIDLSDSAFGLSELVSGSGLLVVDGNSDLEAGSTLWFGLLGTGGLPPGSMINNGTMILNASTLILGNLTGNGVISVTGAGSMLDGGDIGSGETVELHDASLGLERPRMFAPTEYDASIVFNPRSSVTVGWTGATGQMFVPSSENGGDLFLSVSGRLLADIHETGVPEIYASPGPNGTTLVTPYDAGSVLPTVGFTVTDETTGNTKAIQGDSYAGPVAGLNRQFIDITPDTLNITVTMPNVFTCVGSGLNGIDASGAGGTNILDGGTGSAFMIGGSGQDTFYADDRGAQAPIMSTIVNFHAGDDAVIWGIDPSAATMIALDGQGAPGAQGLDLVFSTPGQATASFVLVGYTTADLGNGRLTVSYGRTADMPDLPGSSFVMVHAD